MEVIAVVETVYRNMVEMLILVTVNKVYLYTQYRNYIIKVQGVLVYTESRLRSFLLYIKSIISPHYVFLCMNEQLLSKVRGLVNIVKYYLLL